jgi:3-oxoadipate enol-lactonase
MALVNDRERIVFRGRDGCALHASTGGDGAPLVLLHGGGPDHQMLLPLAERLASRATVVVPDIRGFGRSICRDPQFHTWQWYADDVVALLDHLDVDRALVGGCGMGSGIAMRAGLSAPDRVGGLILISAEHQGENRPGAEEVAWQEGMAKRIREEGLEAGWAEVLPRMPVGMATMVRDALPRSDAESQAAALGTIASQEPFERLADLAALEMPVLVIPGGDANHPRELGRAYQGVLPHARLVEVDMWGGVVDAEGFAARVAPAIADFLATEPLQPR